MVGDNIQIKQYVAQQSNITCHGPLPQLVSIITLEVLQFDFPLNSVKFTMLVLLIELFSVHSTVVSHSACIIRGAVDN